MADHGLAATGAYDPKQSYQTHERAILVSAVTILKIPLMQEPSAWELLAKLRRRYALRFRPEKLR